METQQILFAIWREIGQRLELKNSVGNVVRILQEQVPVAGLELECLDRPRQALELVASSRTASRGRQIAYTATTFDRLLRWCRRGDVLSLRPGMAWPEAVQPIAADYRHEHVLLGPLLQPDRSPAGIAILTADPARPFAADHEELLRELLEPLAAAVANDVRVRELSTLRAAAEADKQSLLTRLGRPRMVDGLIGTDSGLRPVVERVDLVARSDTSILLLGETGSGKEVIARRIHDRSLRGQGPFIRVNCGAIPPELMDSELFGHEKGSFTGALGLRKGWFERADGGTLFLDEIGELPTAAQVRLLRVLQDGTLYRVGGESSLQVDVRVVAATHRDLAAMVAAGRFREDLWYRIAVFPIHIPPLRERQVDIPALAQHFAQRASIKLGLPLQLPTHEDIELLCSYPWPGNVRELAAVIERAAILGNGAALAVGPALGAPVVVQPAGGGEARAAAANPPLSNFPTLDEAMIEHIRAALRRTRGRIEGRQGAAVLLGINPHTLRSRMRKLGLDPQEFRQL